MAVSHTCPPPSTAPPKENTSPRQLPKPLARVDSGLALDEFSFSDEEGAPVSAFGGVKGRSSSLSPRARWRGEGLEV